nr:uncharacterized protein LOC104645557 [Solanum lycopersicum]
MRTKGDIILLSSPLRLSTASLPSPFSIPSLSTPATALPLLCSAAAPLNSRSEWQATKNQQLQTAVFYDNNQQQTMNHQKQKQTIATPNAVPTSKLLDKTSVSHLFSITKYLWTIGYCIIGLHSFMDGRKLPSSHQAYYQAAGI